LSRFDAEGGVKGIGRKKSKIKMKITIKKRIKRRIKSKIRTHCSVVSRES